MAGCRCLSFSLNSNGSCFGLDGGVLCFGDEGPDAALESSSLTLLESPQPESRLVAQELCVLTDGGVTVGVVRG